MIHIQFNDLLAREKIRASGLAVHDIIAPTSQLYMPTEQLERLLKDGLLGLDLADLPNKTKSKTFKRAAAAALGYPNQSGFKRVKPRFLGQNLDLFSQSSRNVQIYNAAIDPKRRYAFAKINDKGIVEAVRVVEGQDILGWGAGETSTSKYQARLSKSFKSTGLLVDDIEIIPNLAPSQHLHGPLPIMSLRDKLRSLVGSSFKDPGIGRERERGDAMHKIVSAALGIQHGDNGQFPDIPAQLLEIKLQTSPTIDLGHTLPSSIAPVPNFPRLGRHAVRHCDCRYAIFYARAEHGLVHIDSLILTTGGQFFQRFNLSGGNQINTKTQRSIPLDFWTGLIS
jgi:hypothetical protein